MNVPASLDAASAQYATAWREFAGAARATADQRDSLAKVITSGVRPAKADRRAPALEAVGRLQGTKDALVAAQTALSRELDALDAAAIGIPEQGRAAFDKSIASLKQDVERPANSVRWNTPIWKETTDGMGVATMFGGMAGTLVGIIGGSGIEAAGGPGVEVTFASMAAGGGLPWLARRRPIVDGFQYVDGITKLTKDAVAGNPAGKKITLHDAGVKSDGTQVRTKRVLRGLERLAKDAEARAGTVDAQATALSRQIGSAREGARTVAKLDELIDSARAGALDQAEQSRRMLVELEAEPV